MSKQPAYKAATHKSKTKSNTKVGAKKRNKYSKWFCFQMPQTSNPHSTHSKSNIKRTTSPSSRITSKNDSKLVHNLSLSDRGYTKKQQITKTLQGEIFIAEKARQSKSQLIHGFFRQIINNLAVETHIICDICCLYYCQEVAIKRTDKALHFEGITVLKDGTKTKVAENIVKEAKLMAMFMTQKPPQSLIKFYDFFQDSNNFYLVMECGGKSLFDFAIQCHQLIKAGILSLKQWRKSVRLIFAKMVRFLQWMHNVVRCCALDISLENIVVGNDTYFDRKSGEIKNLEIRFIDFGLAEVFDANNFICDKFVGKASYLSPQIYKHKLFLANKSDVYSLGMCLFMLSVGTAPFRRPDLSDVHFRIFVRGQMDRLLLHWNRLHYVEKTQYDLMMAMLCIDESERLSIDAVMDHCWIKGCFVNDIKL